MWHGIGEKKITRQSCNKRKTNPCHTWKKRKLCLDFSCNRIEPHCVKERSWCLDHEFWRLLKDSRKLSTFFNCSLQS
ncbi:hypothetical protein GQ457_11G010720 [Hibiscus cannabinus]